MKEEDKSKGMKKPGLPEAIDPSIGNGASWESDPHYFNLRSVDPSSTLDDLLHDETSRQTIIDAWKTALTREDAQIHPDPIENRTGFGSSIDEEQEQKPRTKEKKQLTVKREKVIKPDWLEGTEEELILKEDPNKPRDNEEIKQEIGSTELPLPEGKRVRKAVKKAQKERKVKIESDTAGRRQAFEEALSPFTRWVKGLRGSEYVHPYEDDYALDQQLAAGGEGISETFADLLASQGYKEQALEMYKLLMAKNPEKSGFFAAKIEALK